MAQTVLDNQSNSNSGTEKLATDDMDTELDDPQMLKGEHKNELVLSRISATSETPALPAVGLLSESCGAHQSTCPPVSILLLRLFDITQIRLMESKCRVLPGVHGLRRRDLCCWQK
jgi:hypothetical protein